MHAAESTTPRWRPGQERPAGRLPRGWAELWFSALPGSQHLKDKFGV